MDRNIIEKLQKVLTLSRNAGTEAEAATAAGILQKMLTEYNLSIADLEKKGAAKASATEKAHDLGKAAFTWKLDLAEAVAEFHYCYPLVDRRDKTVRFVGRPENVESLMMLYGWLMSQVKLIASEERTKHIASTNEHVDPLRWQVNFGIGAVQRLAVRLKEEQARTAAEMARNSMGDVVALTVCRETENSDYLEEKYGYRADDRETKRQREWREERERQEKADAEWLARDPEGYYEAYPDRRPEAVAAEKERNAKAWAEYVKRSARNERRRQERRAERSYWDDVKPYDPEEERKQEQAHQAKQAGRSAADRINLKPFLNGQVPAPESKQVKGKKE